MHRLPLAHRVLSSCWLSHFIYHKLIVNMLLPCKSSTNALLWVGCATPSLTSYETCTCLHKHFFQPCLLGSADQVSWGSQGSTLIQTASTLCMPLHVSLDGNMDKVLHVDCTACVCSCIYIFMKRRERILWAAGRHIRILNRLVFENSDYSTFTVWWTSNSVTHDLNVKFCS